MVEKVGFSLAGKMLELLVDPIQRELGYLFCFNNNIQDLETALRQLEATRNDVQAREEAEKRSWKTLGDAVTLWIEDANGKITEAENVIKDKAELQKGCFSIKWCPNLKLRFSLGRKGKKLSLLLIQLLERGGKLPSTGIDLPPPPINMSNYNGDACDFESRQKFMEEMIEMLVDKETKLIGICGMGGIGKTTFAKQLLQKVHDFHKHLFDIQVISTVSSNPNFNAIQQQVIERLRGPSPKERENEIERAERLRSAFDNKKVIVLLDDVWEEFDLNGKGFPLKQTDCCCKIIYTSRTQGLWAGERTIRKKEISLDVLLDEEAWNLFIRKVNLHDDDDDNQKKKKIGRKIVDECKGLPLALEVAGGALIEKDTCNWEDMLFRLQSQHQHHTKKVHKVLETSYGFLEDPIAKHIFLLCCLFPEDGLIPIETLYRYAMGLQLFKGMINDLYRIRNRVYTLVDDLIRRNLLINVEEKRHWIRREVKMHDVVRDVGLSIAKQEEKDIHSLIYDRDHGVNQLQNNIMGPNTKMISILFLNEADLKVLDDVIPRGSKLELLWLDSSKVYGSNIEISWDLFQGRDDLKVLDIIGSGLTTGITWFPHSSPFPPYLSKLRMLFIENMKLNITSNLSFIQHLTCLEILSFRFLQNMGDLPNEVGELKNLKVLDLTGCECFINNGILSKLTNLQELYLWDSFKDWKTLKEDDMGENNNAAKLIELNCLDQLRRLEIIVPKIQQVPRDVRLFSSSTLLEQFKISIGEREFQFERSERSQLWVNAKNVKDNINLFNALGVLIEKDINNLCLQKESNMWEQMYLNRHLSAMKDIKLGHCESIITLFEPSESSCQISRIEETNGFGHLLQCIEIYECNQMRHLCSTSMFMHLKKLKVLVLKRCEKMEEVVNNIEQLQKFEFNTMETLQLYRMSQLTSFCKGIDEICFRRLTYLKLEELDSFILSTKVEMPQLKHLEIIYLPSITNLGNIVTPSLQELKIDGCDKLEYIWFSSSLMVNNIFQLQSLSITKCKMLKGVVEIFPSTEDQFQISIKFSNLMKMELEYLDKLASFVIYVNHLGDEEENEEKSQHALFYYDEAEVSLPCLQELRLRQLSKINYVIGWKKRQGHHDDIEEVSHKEILQPFFPNLKRLELGYFDQLVSFVGFINTIGHNSDKQTTLFYSDDDEVSFSCLEELIIIDLSKINYIVVQKGGRRQHHRNIEEDDYNKKIQPQFFPNLSKLKLSGLDQLVSFTNNIDEKFEEQKALFYHDDDEVSFPSLKRLIIQRLPKINYIVGCKKGRGEDNDIIEEEVQPPIFSILERLEVYCLSNLIHMYPSNHLEVGVLLIQNVKYMEISRCEKLRYLFSEKIGRVAANYLVQLYINNCPMMEVVMKNEELEDNRGEREGNICLPNIHFFPLLWKLALTNLSSLRRFCDIAYTWNLPSLYSLSVTQGCPKLEALSPSSLESPKLEAFYYNYTRHLIEDNWKGDLNAAFMKIVKSGSLQSELCEIKASQDKPSQP